VLQGDFREGDVVRAEVERGGLVLRKAAPVNA
jgi:hypothetical protein